MASKKTSADPSLAEAVANRAAVVDLEDAQAEHRRTVLDLVHTAAGLEIIAHDAITNRTPPFDEEHSPIERAAHLIGSPESILPELRERVPIYAAAKLHHADHATVHEFARSMVDLYAHESSHTGRAERLALAFDILEEEAQRAEAGPHVAFAKDAPTEHVVRLSRVLSERVRALQDRLRQEHIEWPPRAGDPGLVRVLRQPTPPERDGMLAWDALLVEALERIGATGKIAADAVREKALSRWGARETTPPVEIWCLWHTHYRRAPEDQAEPERSPAAMRILARALWRDVVAPALELEARKPASLVRAVHVEATLFHSRAPKYEASSRSLTFEGRKLADSVTATFDIDVITRGLSLIGSVASHELFHWEVTTGHERHLQGVASPHVIEIPGGWVGLARQLNLKEKYAHDLRAIVVAQASFRFTFPDGSRGNMLVLNERPAVGRSRAQVRIELGTVLMPGYVHSSGLPARERKLVPLLRERVPLYGRPNEHGEQRTMSLVVMAQLRDRARELVTEGGVKITHDEFTSHAARAGLPRKLIVPVVSHWLEGDTRAPAFLKKVGQERYTLSDVHWAERAFLEEGGRAELEGVTAGKKSVAKRRAKVSRLGRT